MKMLLAVIRSCGIPLWNKFCVFFTFITSLERKWGKTKITKLARLTSPNFSVLDWSAVCQRDLISWLDIVRYSGTWLTRGLSFLVQFPCEYVNSGQGIICQLVFVKLISTQCRISCRNQPSNQMTGCYMKATLGWDRLIGGYHNG